MPGVGKTTLGKAFCNIKLGEFEGKVCHLEFSGGNPLQRVTLALQYLCQCPSWILQTLTNTDQAKVQFDRRVKGCRVLLVLDNITEENMDEVRYFFEADVGKDSCILLSGRSLDVLVKYFNVESQTCMRVPSLEKEEALEILLARTSTEDSTLGVHKQIDEVVKHLQWENDAPSITAIAHGIGGSGKTTLADAVYGFLRENCKGWKYSKISLPQYLKEYPTIKELQSFILQDLTGKEETVRDSERGRHRLKEVMEKESIFLYIDNALFKKPLQELLPREITNPKKLRLLLTARKMTIVDVMDDCGVKCDIYSIEPLPLEAAIEVLRRKISPEKNISSLSGERPQLEVIAQKCRSCPLFLEVVGGFLRRRRNTVEAYERVLQWMEIGEPFSSDREDRFDEETIMFAFNELEQNAQEAFLDICSFFCGNHWEWDEVSCIVGEEEMKCLEEGVLIKKKDETSYRAKKISRISIHDLLLSVGRNKSRNNHFRTPEELMKAMQNDKDLPALKVVDVSNPPDSWNFNEMCEGLYPNKLWKLALRGCRGTETILNLVKLRDLRRLQLSGCPNLMELPESLGRLSELQELNLSHCERLKLLPVGFGKLKALVALNLSGCSSLQELPMDFVNLSSLQDLNFSYCKSLQELPRNFEKFASLQYLNLRGCSELIRLPERLGNLTCLREIDFGECQKLNSLPQSLGGMTSLSMSWMSFWNYANCSRLTELPEEISWLSGVKHIEFCGLSSLKKLPAHFSKLTCLQTLDLEGCESIQELCNDFHRLEVLITLSLRQCRGLSILPQGFGKLTSLKTLDLSEFDKLEELCNDFHCLGALEELSLSGCSNLANLSNDFHTLPSLIRINLCNCKRLGAEWMNVVGATQSLCYADISGNECMTQRWNEMQREREQWDLLVVTESSSTDIRGTLWPLILEKVMWRTFCKAGLLIDALQRLFCSSFLPAYVRLILITESYSAKAEAWGMVQGNLERLQWNLERLQCISKESAIIYIGTQLDAIPSELVDRAVAHSPFHSFLYYFSDVLPKSFYHSRPGVFTASISLERNTVKYLSNWEDISYVSDEFDFLTRNPTGSNVDLLRKLCETEETDFLLYNDEQALIVLVKFRISFYMINIWCTLLFKYYVLLIT